MDYIQSNKLPLLINGKQLNKSNLQWYDMIQCYHYDCTMPNNPIEIYIPVAVLKHYNILPADINIDLGDERQYNIDFKNFYKSFSNENKNIDMLFDEYIQKKREFAYRDLFKFVRFLYRAQWTMVFNKKPQEENTEDCEGIPREQGLIQFIKEFKEFAKTLTYCKKFNDKYYLIFIRDLLKIFILFKSLKIRKVDILLYKDKSSLDEISNTIQVSKNAEKIFKDIGSIAPLDGLYTSRNSTFIMKFYTLLFINLDLSIEDLHTIILYVRDINNFEKEFLNSGDRNCTTNTVEGINIYAKEFIDYYISKVKSCLPMIKMSLPIYYILKFYIDNKVKVLTWRKISLDILKNQVKIQNLDSDKLKRLFDITKDIKIENKDDIFKALTGNVGSLKIEDLDFIYDIIFSNDRSNKSKKREKLKNHFEKINIIEYTYLNKSRAIGDVIDSKNKLYTFIITAKLYFETYDISLNAIKITNKSLLIDDRNKTIGSIYNQITKKILTEEHYKEWCKDDKFLADKIDHVYVLC